MKGVPRGTPFLFGNIMNLQEFGENLEIRKKSINLKYRTCRWERRTSEKIE